MADENPIPNLEPRVLLLEQIAGDTRTMLARLEGRFDAIDGRFDSLERRFDSLDRRMDALEKRQHTDFLVLLTIYLAGYAGLLGAMAHGFKWI